MLIAYNCGDRFGTVSSKDYVSSIKQQIFLETGVFHDRLLLDGRQVHDDFTLEAYELNQNSILKSAPRLKGGLGPIAIFAIMTLLGTGIGVTSHAIALNNVRKEVKLDSERIKQDMINARKRAEAAMTSSAASKSSTAVSEAQIDLLQDQLELDLLLSKIELEEINAHRWKILNETEKLKLTKEYTVLWNMHEPGINMYYVLAIATLLVTILL
jgi:hypothetical protein